MTEAEKQQSLPRIVSPQEWLAARREFLVREKEFTRARDALNAQRRELPMVAVEKDYVFEGPDGDVGLLDLFEGRRQLIVHHVMFDPSWDEGCSSCRFQIRDLGHLPHLHERGTSLALVSRAPYAKIQRYKERMGWSVPYFSSYGSHFNYDFHATLDESKQPLLINFRTKEEHEEAVGPWDVWGHELPAVSVFLSEGDTIYHTYSSFSRGLDILIFTLNYLDLTPLGRDGG
ncbi:Predicted dithiol-disulfide oxidoreductase, DUF899 family [Streptomyces sp. MnatMP-M77]|uniref:DUF899 domain-containing protein n=1 Tax=unclassified Streptomyces TaxID=2593676 RepID=UPI000804E4ED|nr:MULTISPECIES: DUF899 domain-containing protein [unclassified Streptomyces]MYT78979.1 DUF899 domain-containing protein [Streptomyces sp. SID8364]SBU94126.1 Predicted dithiol-disulfide oxidoreductase, DUF899 family [Streptomyces sp. MnatMP-M77]SCD93961.1 Predicted dithiol-disulfide oxidoreductase, DUF899 family [Streptomyces sp. OspMP-M43]